MTDKEFLISRGWVETNKAGPWRWYKPEVKPASFYTFKDAVSLEQSMQRQSKVGKMKIPMMQVGPISDWPRYDPRTGFWLCKSCWNDAYHFCKGGGCDCSKCYPKRPKRVKFTGEGQELLPLPETEAIKITKESSDKAGK